MKLTLDVIGLAGFGYDFKSQVDPNGKLPTAVTTVLHVTLCIVKSDITRKQKREYFNSCLSGIFV